MEQLLPCSILRKIYVEVACIYIYIYRGKRVIRCINNMEKTCPGRQTSTSRIIEVKRRTREHDNIVRRGWGKKRISCTSAIERIERRRSITSFYGLIYEGEERGKNVLKTYRGNELEEKLNLFVRGKKLGGEIQWNLYCIYCIIITLTNDFLSSIFKNITTG